MRVIFVSDLHGRIWKFERLAEYAHDLHASVVINGGDVYPNHLSVSQQGEFITTALDHHFSQFNASGIYYLCYPGNDDPIILDQLFKKTCEKYPFVIFLAQRKFNIDAFEFIGMNWIVDYPFRLKDRCRMDSKNHTFQEQYGTGFLSNENGWKEIKDWFDFAKTLPTIEDELNQLVRPDDFSNSVYILHMPPANLGLDLCYGEIKVGSTSITRFLEKFQPLLSLHGHIHESPEVSGKWHAKIGNTVCIQPGQLEKFTCVTINLTNMQFQRIIDD